MKTCDTCKHYNRILVPCYGCINMSAWEPKSQTRADRIRARTDEELAEFLAEYGCAHKAPHCMEANCAQCWLELLRQEAEEGAGTT